MSKNKNNLIIHITMGFGGGLGTIISNLIRYQLDKGYRVGVIYRARDNKFDEIFLDLYKGKIDLYPVKMINTRGVNQLFGLPVKRIFKRIVKKNPNYNVILHAHNPVSIGLLRNINNLPLVCTIHGINTRKSIISQVLTLLILKRLKRRDYQIIGISSQTSQYYNDSLSCNYIKTVLNGIEINPVKNPYKFEKFTIGYLAYLNELKGWRVLFDSYNLLEECYKEKIDLVFVGMGTKEEINKLNNLIEIYDLFDKVKYLGVVENAGNKITPYLDLVVLPSYKEGLGLTLVEAIGNGVPILATEVGGIPEVLDDGKNGYFIKRNPEDISEKICRIFDQNELYLEMSKNGLKKYQEKFNLSKMGEEYSTIYKRITREG